MKFRFESCPLLSLAFRWGEHIIGVIVSSSYYYYCYFQQTHNVVTTSLQRNVTTLQRRCNDVEATLCVCWVIIIIIIPHNHKLRTFGEVTDGSPSHE